MDITHSSNVVLNKMMPVHVFKQLWYTTAKKFHYILENKDKWKRQEKIITCRAK